MTTIQGFTPPPNHATMGVESTILDNLTPAPSDMSGQGEPDMSAKLKQRAVINGKVFWLTDSTHRNSFNRICPTPSRRALSFRRMKTGSIAKMD